MSQSRGGDDLSYFAAGDLSTKQFRGMVFSAEQTVNVAGANVPTCGILQDLPDAAGVAARVRHSGTSKGVAGAAFAANALLTTDAQGRWVTATSGQNVGAKAIEAATAVGDIVEMMVLPTGIVA